MKLRTIILGLLAFAVVCYGHIEAPKRCCFNENQYEAYYGGNVGIVQDGTPIAFSEVIQMATDVTGQRIGTEGVFHYYKGVTVTTKTIQLFKEGKQYTILNKTCTVQPLQKESGPKKCIPDNAVFSQYLDVGKHELLTESWQVNATAQGLLGATYVSVSSKTCAPLGASFHGIVQSGGKQIQTVLSGGYYNISSGIKDPKKWFSVPSSCPQNLTDMQFGHENPMADFFVKITPTFF